MFSRAGGYEASLVVLSLIQIFLTAGVYSYCLMWLYSRKLNVVVWGMVAIAYTFCPFLSITMVNLFKDVPFSLLLLAWMPVLVEYFESSGENLKKKSVLAEICLCLILSLLRNNGVYVSCFIIIAMLIMYPRKWKFMVAFFFMMGLVVLGSYMFEKENHVTHLFKETVGIPLQQMAAVVCYDGKMTAEQEAFIDRVISVDYIKENYDPYSADKLKWGGAPLDNSFLNENKIEFLKTWGFMLPGNFEIYVKAYLKNTYGFWSLDNSHTSQRWTSIYTEAFSEWIEEEGIRIKTILPENLQNKIEDFLTPLTVYFGAGIAIWMFLLCLIAFSFQYNWRALIVGAPVLGNQLTIMISTPVAYQWRYVYCIAMALPFMVGLLFINCCNMKKDT